jgi:hypothetical protein
MSKITITVLLTICTLFSSAQVNWMIRGGYNYTSAKAKFHEKRLVTDPKSAFNIGVGVKAFFDYNIYFTPQLNYTMKGYTVFYGADSNIASSNTTLHMVEFPILLQTYLNPTSHNRFFLQYGPVITLTVAGKERVILQNGSFEDRKLRFGSTVYGRWEASLMGGIGIEMGDKLTAAANFNVGLTNLANSDYGPKLRTSVISLNFGYYFK